MVSDRLPKPMAQSELVGYRWTTAISASGLTFIDLAKTKPSQRVAKLVIDKTSAPHLFGRSAKPTAVVPTIQHTVWGYGKVRRTSGPVVQATVTFPGPIIVAMRTAPGARPADKRNVMVTFRNQLTREKTAGRFPFVQPMRDWISIVAFGLVAKGLTIVFKKEIRLIRKNSFHRIRLDQKNFDQIRIKENISRMAYPSNN